MKLSARILRLRGALLSPMARRVLALLVLSVGTAIFVVDYVRVPDRGLEVGEVALRDIRAPTTLEYVDWDETLARQREAEAAVPPVFDFDATLASRIQARLSDAFEAARARHGEALMAARAAGRQRLSDEELSRIALDFIKLLELPLELSDIELVTRHRWDRRIEDLARELVGVAMQGYIVADRSVLPTDGRAVSVVRLFGDRRDEVQLDDFSQVVTPDEARRRITLYALESLDDSVDPDVLRAAQVLARAAVRPNFSYNQLVTEDRRKKAREGVSEVVVRVARGTAIVREGDVVTPQQVEMLEALRQARSTTGTLGILFAFTVLGGILYLALYNFAAGFIRKFSTNPRDIEAMTVLGLLVLGLSRILVELSGPLSGLIGLGIAPSTFWYLAPVAGGAMLVRILVNSETALVWTVAISGMAGMMLDQQVLFTVFFIVSGVVAAGGIAHTKERVNVLRAGVVTGLYNASAALVINLVQAHMGDGLAAAQPLWDVGFAFLGASLGAILVLGLVPLFEQFGFVTDYKLLELANLNHPLLRQLMLRAPGTYHHSVTVAQLCEAAAEAVGANALLTRVACYFHDIGKAVQPRFFIENQAGGPNPHDKLDPRTSARVIINHVLDGEAIARQHKLPGPVIDGIVMHHGTGLIQYFYARALEQAKPGETVDEADFRYPGRLPDTRETGIMMLADRVEAACRSLKDKSPDNIRNLIQRLVNNTVLDGQLDRCPLTIKDLVTISETFTATLLGIYHQRIDYPGLPPRRDAPETTGPIITLEIPNPLAGGVPDPAAAVLEGGATDPGRNGPDGGQAGLPADRGEEEGGA